MTRRSLSLIEVVVALANVALLVLLLLPASSLAHDKAARTKCSGNLRQLGIAAIQYGDDKRFFPKVGKLTALEGDWTTSDATRTVRALLWYGYTDEPEGWICAASDDRKEAIFSPGLRGNLKQWFWSSPSAYGTITGGPGQSGGSLSRPPWQDGLRDHSLDATSELSYGWTRKGMNINVRSTALLAADRALRDEGSPQSLLATIAGTRGMRGNHSDGWNLLQSDASVVWLARDGSDLGDNPAAALTSTSMATAGVGFLAMYDQRDPGW